jgi:hypothetical protein
MRFKKTYKSAFPKSVSTGQQYCNFTHHLQSISAKAEVEKNEGVNNYDQPNP